MSENWRVAFVDGTELYFDPIELILDDDAVDKLIKSGKAEVLDDILDGMRVSAAPHVRKAGKRGAHISSTGKNRSIGSVKTPVRKRL